MTTAPRAIAPAVNAWNAEYLDDQYSLFRADPASVSPELRAFFAGFDLGVSRGDLPTGGSGGVETSAIGASGGVSIESARERLIDAYRRLGHFAAETNPFGAGATESAASWVSGRPQELSPAFHGISEADLDRRLASGVTMRGVIADLEASYCRSLGAEFMHCATRVERDWFATRIEGSRGKFEFPAAVRLEILEQLTRSETFERFLGKRYQGKKRFSLEGGETLIPMLKQLTAHAGTVGVREIILGMAHRGRLNVLWNYLGKATEQLMTEFEDSWVEGTDQGGGDVKYHRGYSCDQPIEGGGSVHLSMLNNPSHLESVNPIVMGRCRARQDGAGGDDAARRAYLPLLIHGDGAVIGQGIVAECLNLAALEGYTVGGTMHVVINNQVAFTTDPRDGRSTAYCTDVAKMIDAPVLHVNADDPEACVWASRLAVDYRRTFGKDVFIDLVCYRKWGHNEQDEPRYTQPGLYARVGGHLGTRAVYLSRLAGEGLVTAERGDAMVESVVAELDAAQAAVKASPRNPVPPPGGGSWDGFVGKYSFESPSTAITEAQLAEICAALGRAPDGFTVNGKLKTLLEARANLPKTRKLSHADGELLSYASLALEGINVRVSGQDARRGTFTSRHAVLRDEKTGERYTPMNHVRAGQKGRASFWDSPLSEFSVMGFDYGYSRGDPRTLVCWEGQFGDFANGAQVMIDQYLASSEIKWNRWAGLALLLPHGYEGQGPEHSSARLERFLQLCADENMEVVYPTTGAQIFHLLRRQAKRNFRKPLIVMTPKKFLRVETATVDELMSGGFQHVIDDAEVTSPGKVTSVVYCSGKIYHELNDRRKATGRGDVALVRIEQLYPLHVERLRGVDARYPSSARRVWAQEEPRNAGAYLYIADAMREALGLHLDYVGRPASASPATGSEKVHAKQQEKILSAIAGALASSSGVKPGASSGPMPNGEASIEKKPTTPPDAGSAVSSLPGVPGAGSASKKSAKAGR